MNIAGPSLTHCTSKGLRVLVLAESENHLCTTWVNQIFSEAFANNVLRVTN